MVIILILLITIIHMQSSVIPFITRTKKATRKFHLAASSSVQSSNRAYGNSVSTAYTLRKQVSLSADITQQFCYRASLIVGTRTIAKQFDHLLRYI